MYMLYSFTDGTNAGGLSERDRLSGLNSDENGCSSRKRARADVLTGNFFDLNLPAEVVDRN